VKGARGIVESRSESFIPVTERGARPKKGKNEEREFVSWIFFGAFLFCGLQEFMFSVIFAVQIRVCGGSRVVIGEKKGKKR